MFKLQVLDVEVTDPCLSMQLPPKPMQSHIPEHYFKGRLGQIMDHLKYGATQA